MVVELYAPKVGENDSKIRYMQDRGLKITKSNHCWYSQNSFCQIFHHLAISVLVEPPGKHY